MMLIASTRTQTTRRISRLIKVALFLSLTLTTTTSPSSASISSSSSPPRTTTVMSAAAKTFDTTKKLCIVVGLGKGGIGDSLAKKFSSEGYNVAMVARSDLSRLEDVIPNSKSYRCDASDPEQVQRCVTTIQTDMGPTVHALMYNAGSGVFKPFAEVSYDDFMLSMKVGPGGVFLWTKACLDSFASQGASIGLTGATASWRGMPFTPAFAPSKMATRGLAQALARDLGPSRNIHVFHVIIDGLVNIEGSAVTTTKTENEMLSPARIAETYWQLHCQPPTCWTQETHVAAQAAYGSIASI